MENLEKENLSTEENKSDAKASPGFHNLYKHLNISVRTLDYIIVSLIAALAIAVLIGLNNRGFVVEFDSQGGTPVASQKHLYGETIEYIEPEREGYKFNGWATDSGCKYYWDKGTEINGSLKLYACWLKQPENE